MGVCIKANGPSPPEGEEGMRLGQSSLDDDMSARWHAVGDLHGHAAHGERAGRLGRGHERGERGGLDGEEREQGERRAATSHGAARARSRWRGPD